MTRGIRRTIALVAVAIIAAIGWHNRAALQAQWRALTGNGANPADAGASGAGGRIAGPAGAGDGRGASGPAKSKGGKAAARRPVPVKVGDVVRRDVPIRLRVVGRVESPATVALRSRIDGQIASIHYGAGQHVEAGALLVTLDDRLQKAQLAQASANLRRDEANLARARADLARSEELVAKGFVSTAQRDAARATLDSLVAAIAANRAAIDLARTQLGFTRIHAPMNAVAGDILAHPGTIVKANDTQLLVLRSVRPVNVAFSLPESRLADVRERGAVRALPVSVTEESRPDVALDGRLVFVDSSVDATTGTVGLKAELPNEDERLAPGQSVAVDLTLRVERDAIVFPSIALQTGPRGPFVYVARDDGTVAVRSVRARPADEGAMVAVEGLTPGERVVTDGHLRLVPGARYVVPAEGASRGPADGGAKPK